MLPRLVTGAEYREAPGDCQRTAPCGRSPCRRRIRPGGWARRMAAAAAVCLTVAGCDWLAPVTVPDPIPAATLHPTLPTTPQPTPTRTPTETPVPAPTVTARPTLAPRTPDATPQASPDPLNVLSGNITISLWHSLDPDGPAGKLLAAQIAEFEQVYPQVRVEATWQGSDLALHRALLGAIGAPDGPDLTMARGEYLAEYVGAGIVAPLDGYLSDPEIGLSADSWEDLIPGGRAIGLLPQYGNQRYGLPFALNALGLWYNLDVLRQAGYTAPPHTWAELEDVARAVTTVTGQAGYGYVPSGELVEAWFLSRGVPIAGEDGAHSAFATPEGAEALAMLARLHEAGATREYASREEGLQAFADGRVALWIDTTAAAQDLRRSIAGADGSLAAIGQALLPHSAEHGPGSTLLTGNVLVILRGEELRQTAAWLLIRYLSEPRQTASWARMGYLPVRASAGAYLADEYARSPVLRQQVERIAPYAQPAPSLRCLGEVEDYLLEALLSARDGTATAEEALARAASLADEALAVRCR